MNYINFSKSYHVRMLTDRDIPLILALCEKNTQFYEHCPPFVTAESIRDDMCALPQRKMDEPQDKYYLGFSGIWQRSENQLLRMIHIILGLLN